MPEAPPEEVAPDFEVPEAGALPVAPAPPAELPPAAAPAEPPPVTPPSALARLAVLAVMDSSPLRSTGVNCTALRMSSSIRRNSARARCACSTLVRFTSNDRQ